MGEPMTDKSSVVERAASLLRSSRYFVLASTSERGAWAATINFVLTSQGKLLYYSSRTSHHAKDMAKNPRIAGAIYKVQDDGSTDGLQFIGHCNLVSATDLLDAQGYSAR